MCLIYLIVQISHSVVSDTLWPHRLQDASFPVLHQLWSLLILMSIKSAMLSNHLILCLPLLLLSIFASITLFFFFKKSILHIRRLKYWSFIFSISPLMNIQDWFPLGLTQLTSLQSKRPSRVFSNTIVQKHQFFGAQLCLWFKSHIHMWLLEKP